MLIFTIAAAADCSCPYTSESSCSGWKTSCSRKYAAASVPICVAGSTCEPTSSTAAVDTTPRNSITGKKTEKIFCA